MYSIYERTIKVSIIYYYHTQINAAIILDIRSICLNKYIYYVHIMNQHTKLISSSIDNMILMSQGARAGSILLTGDPGIGKTTMVEMLSYILGIPSIVIEIPHITEEHLINIPFLIYSPATNDTKAMHSQEQDGTSGGDYKMVLAQSNLYTQIMKSRTMPDDEYIQHIKNAPAHIKEAYKQLGGSDDVIPPKIKAVRAKYQCILFLDEFYRQAPVRIQNILRGILNKRIGLHQLPASTCVMYASNMRDSGLSTIPSNHQFRSITFKPATSKEWFAWFTSKYQNNAEVQLNPTVIKKFQSLLKDNDISFTDIDAEVRTSPRRWEQLLLYINGALPVKNLNDAKSLLTYVNNNFINYLTGAKSSLAGKVMTAVSELIETTSNIKTTETNADHDWRQTLAHEVDMQIKLGSNRKHIPVISGDPGIGKTTEAWKVAADHNMRLIDVDVSEVYSDDVTGLPIPGNSERSEAGGMTIKFSVPKLYQQIMSQIKREDDQYIAGLKSQYGADADAKIKQYQQQKYKYLILFDEINRVDEKTFNSLRKIILEKNFGPSGDNSGKLLTLPKDSVVIAAMNPHGSEDVTELTSHFRDVIDVIPAKASWKSTVQYLQNKHIKSYDDTEISDRIKESTLTIIQQVVDKFATRDPRVEAQQRPFILSLPSAGDIYVSPREYTDMYAQMAYSINDTLKQLPTTSTPDEAKAALDDVIVDALEENLNHPIAKAGYDGEEFINTLKLWVQSLTPDKYGTLLSKFATTTSVGDTMAKWIGKDDITKMPDDLDIINAHNSMDKAQLINEIHTAIEEKITDANTLEKYVLEDSVKRVEYVDGDLKQTGDMTSHLTNFVLATLYTLHIHGFDNDRIGTIGKGVAMGFKDVINSMVKTHTIDKAIAMEAISTIATLRSDVLDFVDSLPEQV